MPHYPSHPLPGSGLVQKKHTQAPVQISNLDWAYCMWSLEAFLGVRNTKSIYMLQDLCDHRCQSDRSAVI